MLLMSAVEKLKEQGVDLSSIINGCSNLKVQSCRKRKKDDEDLVFDEWNIENIEEFALKILSIMPSKSKD